MTKKRAMSLLPLAATLLATLLAGCAARPPATDQPPTAEVGAGQVWQLVEMRGKAVADSRTTLEFNPKTGYLNGGTPCNSYAARYTLEADGTLRIDPEHTGTGSVRCPDADMEAEGRYVALLHKADSLSTDATTLTLFQKGRAILKYELR